MSKTVSVPYFQYSGTGNTFILIDNREETLGDPIQVAQEVCERFSVDGLLLIEDSSQAELKMRIINRDGSEVSMCGNGSRCVAHWARHHAGFRDRFTMETGAGILGAMINEETVKVHLTDPHALRKITDLKVEGAIGEIYMIDTGVPHVVIEVKGIEKLDVHGCGEMIRNHKLFQPKGTNASFFEPLDGGTIKVRVYERGVEAETQSCGTGSTACALIASIKHGLTSPVEVKVRCEETLKIYFEKNEESFSGVHLEGQVTCLDRGVL